MWKRIFPFMGIRAKLNFSIILMLLLVTVFIDLVVYQIYKQDIEEKELSSMKDANEILSDNIENLITSIEDILMNEIGRCDVFGYQSSLSEAASASVERKMRGLATLMHFRGIDCKNIFILDKYTCRFLYDYQQTNGITLEDLRKKQIYLEISTKQEHLFQSRGSTVWRSFPDSPQEIYIIKSYVDPVDMNYKGIVCLTIEREVFQSLLGEHKFDSIIYDEHGSLLYDSRNPEENISSNLDEWDEYLSTETTVRRKRGEWKLVGLIAKKEAFGEISALFKMLAAIEAVVFIVMIYIVYRVSEGFLWNVMALTNNFKQINAGEQISRIIPHSHDETAYLCEQFDSMYDQLKENAKQMVLSSMLLEKAEYNSLLAQMNPHFLYNTLESVSAMAKLSGQEDIVRVIQMLSHLLRASLSGGKQEIPLRQELVYIRYYLELQKIVTGGRITWDIAADKELEECPVPKLILQPIVENSIIHGLNELLDDAIIIITADVRENHLVLDVCDNGKGVDQKIIDELLQEDDEPTDGEDRAHIGIRSIQKRLHILYGCEYGLEMHSEPGNGMIVRLNLPYRKGTDSC